MHRSMNLDCSCQRFSIPEDENAFTEHQHLSRGLINRYIANASLPSGGFPFLPASLAASLIIAPLGCPFLLLFIDSIPLMVLLPTGLLLPHNRYRGDCLAYNVYFSLLLNSNLSWHQFHPWERLIAHSLGSAKMPTSNRLQT